MSSAPEPRRVVWRDGQPYSVEFGDVYFSSDNGLAETRHVFLQHNQLEQRWQALSAPHFTIAETGFGTGLNFLCAWALWRKSATKDARLHFVSVERYPLSHDELKQALDLWPALADLSAELLTAYRTMAPGWHRLQFDQGRVTLTIIIGDVLACLPLFRARVDAWFLDGFAPAKNPEMWQDTLFSEMARLSRPGTTFATFTSAGVVKRGLQSAGFVVHKTPGYGRKREMLCGEFGRHVSEPGLGDRESRAAPSQAEPTSPEPTHVNNRPVAPYAQTLSPPDARQPVKPHAIVIGGGIAGTASAHALAVRGWQVTLIERHEAIAREASGNPQAMLYPRLSGQDIALSRLAQHGHLNTLRLMARCGLAAQHYALCGLLQTAFDAHELARCQAVATRQLPESLVRYVDAETASDIAGMPLQHSALYFPEGGWIDPVAFCLVLASHPNIRLLTHTSVLELHRLDSGWQVADAHQALDEAPVVILACANQTAQFAQTRHLPLQPVRGQITLAEAGANSARLRAVICSDGYVSPAYGGRHCLGATFGPGQTTLDVRDSDHEVNLAMLSRLCPELYRDIDKNHLGGRVALRAATPDRLPMAGPLLDSAALHACPPAASIEATDLPWLDGLFVNTGHGSKGLLNAPLCAEILASALCGEPAPVDSQLLAALDPNRFLLRKMGLKRLVAGLAARP